LIYEIMFIIISNSASERVEHARRLIDDPGTYV
jgi:hypothetical protein